MKISAQLKARLEAEIISQALPADYMQTVDRWLLPMAAHLQALKHEAPGVLLVSFNGSQGSGKSTLTRFLSLLLKHHFELNTVDISIDDFYLTRSERLQLAEQVHPLLVTRGVPGTHDVKLAANTIECLREVNPQNPCELPRFDKANDDRAPQADWDVIDEEVDIVLFEGWCNHAPVQTEQQLAEPVNELEKNEDDLGRWRQYVNEQLDGYHLELFSQADVLIYLQIPDFDVVYEWRGLQEQKLAARNPHSGNAVMDEAALRRFIQHYERITRACLDELPKRAQIVARLNRDHQIEAIHFND